MFFFFHFFFSVREETETLGSTCDYVFERLESFSAAANEVVNTEAVQLSHGGALQPRRVFLCDGSLKKLLSRRTSRCRFFFISLTFIFFSFILLSIFPALLKVYQHFQG